MYKDINI